jgi:hypothetical protein
MFRERDIDYAERSVVEQLLVSEPMPRRLWSLGKYAQTCGALAVSIGFLVIFVWLVSSVNAPDVVLFGLAPLAGVALCATGVCLFLLWVGWQWKRQEADRIRHFKETRSHQLRDILKQGRVRAFSFSARRAVFFEPVEDEGEVLVFEGHDDQCLLLAGETVGPLFPEQKPWPGRTFELVESVNGTEFLGIFGDGTALQIDLRSREEAADEVCIGTSLDVKSGVLDARLVHVPLAECLAKISAHDGPGSS